MSRLKQISSEEIENNENFIRLSDNVNFDVNSGLAGRGIQYTLKDDSIPIDQQKYSTSVPQLQISLTDKCNMGCKYCSFRAREGADNKPVNMSIETAKKAVMFFKETIDPQTRYAQVDFGLAGEPLLRRRLHPELIEEVRKQLEDSDLEKIWVGTNTTNATLGLNEDIADRIAPPMDLSCDGPKHVHDDMRPYVDGRGTYDDVVKVCRKVLAKHPTVGVSAVLTARHPDFVEIFRHLREDIGFCNIYMKPVNLPYNETYGLNVSTLQIFKKAYTDFINYFISLDRFKLLDNLLSLNSDDYFMRFFYRVKDRSHQVYRCGAAKQGAYVDTNGRLFACAHFIGKTGWHIGDLENGFDKEKINQFQQLHVDTREPCKSCWARYLCGGGCYYQAVLANGDIAKPDLVKCELIIHLCKEAIRLLTFLSDHYPEVLSALPSPYYIPRKDQYKSAKDHYLPTAKFIKTPIASELSLCRAYQVEETILEPNSEISAKFYQKNKTLKVELYWNDLIHIDNISLWMLNLEHEPFLMEDLLISKPYAKGDTLRIDQENKLVKAELIEKDKVRTIPYKNPFWKWVEESTLIREKNKISITFSLKSLWGDQLPKNMYGFNLHVSLIGGGLLRLARYEPFCLIDVNDEGELMPAGGEFQRFSPPTGVFNNPKIEGYIPSGRWKGRMANVC